MKKKVGLEVQRQEEATKGAAAWAHVAIHFFFVAEAPFFLLLLLAYCFVNWIIHGRIWVCCVSVCVMIQSKRQMRMFIY